MENNLNFSIFGGYQLSNWIDNIKETYNFTFNFGGTLENDYYDFYLTDEKINIDYKSRETKPLISFEEFLENHEQTIINYILGIETNTYSII